MKSAKSALVVSDSEARERPVRDYHVIGTRCKASNGLSRGVLISRFLLGNLITTKLCSVTLNESGSEFWHCAKGAVQSTMPKSTTGESHEVTFTFIKPFSFMFW